MFTVPLTRGSRAKFFPVMSAMDFTTPSMSALTKLGVTVSGSAAPAGDAGARQTNSATAAVTTVIQARSTIPRVLPVTVIRLRSIRLRRRVGRQGRLGRRGHHRQRCGGRRAAFLGQGQALAHATTVEDDMIAVH